jgi:hypothetical protein
MDSLEQWLETELRKADTDPGSTVPAPRFAELEPPRHRSRVIRLLVGLGAFKAALAASAVVALAAGGIATGKAVTTGDPNPFDNWGSSVTKQVQTCKANPSQHGHGIGQCVSALAKTHGESVSDDHSNGAEPPKSAPTGPPSSHPTGPPASVPGAGTDHPTRASTVTPPAVVPTPAAVPAEPVHPTGHPSTLPPPRP